MFDRFAGWAAKQVARAWFFSMCVGIVVVWVPSYFVIRDLDTWQLIINTTTTIITFLLVALLQNTQDRFERRMKRDQKVERLALAQLLRQIHLAKHQADATGPILQHIIDELEGRN